MVEGPVSARAAVDAGWDVEAEFVAHGTTPVTTAPAFELAPGVMERVASTTTPQANLVVVRRREPGVTLGDLSFVVVADRVGDPGNLGTILRSAEAAGVEAIVLTAGSVDVTNPKTVRASAGAMFHVPVIEVELDDVRDAGLRLIGTTSHGGVSHTDADWTGRIALVLGNEAHGLDDDAPVDTWVRIDHRGRAESLNVAMAATVLCFEAARHRA